MANILTIGSSALLALQQQLATTSHNIANATRPEYSRQRVGMVAQRPDEVAGGFIGTGVSAAGITRSYDAFLVSQVRDYTTLTAGQAKTSTLLDQINYALGDAETGLSAGIDDLFAAINDLTADPSSNAAREVVLAAMDSLVGRFHGLSDFLDELTFAVSDDIRDTVSRVNTLSADIAATNQAIILASGASGGAPPNDLLDQQDALLQELSALVDISVLTASNGAVDVFIGNGQSLVLGGSSTALSTAPDPFNASELVVLHGSNGANITSQLTQGELGALLQAQDGVITDTRNELGRIAYVLADSMNEVHLLGVDPTGSLGADLFSLPPVAVGAGKNTGSLVVDAAVSDAAALQPSDYLLQQDMAGDFLITRLSDGTVQNLGPGPGPFSVDGVEITLVSGSAVAGDSFLIQPTAGVASGIERAVTDASEIAAGVPIITGAALGNTGSAVISDGRMVDTTGPAFTVPGALSPPVAIRFIDAGNYEILDYSNPALPVVLETAIPYSAGGEVFPTPGGLDFGYRMTLSGVAAAGDLFTVDYNSDGVGDNRNALLLADLQNIGTLDGGSQTYQAAYASLVGGLGADAQSAAVTLAAADALLLNAQSQRDSVSGVNLDEEAANLLRFQQAYEAAAQTLQVGDELFQTLLNALG
ncbi:MAG: flagellar hook-associated protein FlgK [Pseudomonadota bacterium]|nr:flagellar hook-associated protein FlgK [Pseudomonadota bacterium]